MMIIFHSVEIQNFFSWGHQPTQLNLSEHRLNLITGKSGSGKSSLLSSAIYFCLFGKTYKNINKPSLINSINNSNLLVKIIFETNGVQYTVERGIKPAVFKIYENTHLISQPARNEDYQEFLEKNILKMNDKIFKQIVFVGSSTYIPFLKLPLALRRDIIENILNIKIYSLMLTKLKEQIMTTENKIVLLDYEIRNIQGKLEAQRKILSSLMENNQHKITEIQLNLNKLNKQKEKIEVGLQTLVHKFSKILNAQIKQNKNEIQEQLETINHQLIEFRLRKEKLEDDIFFISENDYCSTCHQSIDTSFKAAFVEKRQKEKNQIEQQITTRLNEIQSIKEILFSLKELENTQSLLRSKLKEINQHMLHYEQEIIRLQQQDTDTLIDSSEIEITLDQAQNKRNDLQRQLLHFKSILPILKDSGIKTRVIKKHLPKINKILNEYLELLFLPVSFHLNEEFKEDIKSRYKDIFSYENFSDGEQARIDLAIMLVLRELSKMTHSIDTNLLILDEADAALDDELRKAFFNLYNRVLSNKNIFVISHHCDQELYEKYDKVHTVEKTGNFSALKRG